MPKNDPQKSIVFEKTGSGRLQPRKNPRFDQNLKLETHGYNEEFGVDCVELSVNEMLEIEIYMRNYFEKEIQLKPNYSKKTYLSIM